MPRRPRIDVDLDQIGRCRVARTADLVAAGLPSSTVARRCHAGRWQYLLPGVILLQSGPPTREQEVRGALLFADDDAVVTGAEAVRRHGLDRAPSGREVPVLVGEDRQRRPSGFVIISRTERLPTPLIRDGVPIAPLERAVIDTVRQLHVLDDIRALVAEAVQRRRTTVARLREELEAGCQRGTALPRDVLEEVAEGIRSAAEGWALDVHRVGRLPAIMWNANLWLPSGRFLCCTDGWFDDVAMAWEIDSVEYHPVYEDTTARRRAAMTSEGVVVAHHRPRRLLRDRPRVIEEVWGTYRLAASRPRPPIRAVSIADAA